MAPELSSFDKYQINANEAWVELIHSLNPKREERLIVSNQTQIANIIDILSKAPNHMHFPTGGGQDISGADIPPPFKYLDILQEEFSAYRVKPRKLYLEYIVDQPSESFVWIELAPLPPSMPLSSKGFHASKGDFQRDEFLDVNGKVYDRHVLERGFLGHDENGYEIDIPSESKRVVAMGRGALLWVCKGSIWNQRGSYIGKYMELGREGLRKVIERCIDNPDINRYGEQAAEHYEFTDFDPGSRLSRSEKRRVNEVVQWFESNYSDPIDDLPYDGKEGGYQFIQGAAVETEEGILRGFDDLSEVVFQAALEQINLRSGGIDLWNPGLDVPEIPEEYDFDEKQDLTESKDFGAPELLIGDAPLPGSPDLRQTHLGVAFKANPGGSIDIDHSSDEVAFVESGFADIISQLIKMTNELSERLVGTNCYLDLEKHMTAYNAAITRKPASISGMYIQALLAEEAYKAIQNDKTGETYPPMVPDMQSACKSILRLNRTALASTNLGRKLLDNEIYGRHPGVQQTPHELLQGINNLPILTSSAAEAIRADINSLERKTVPIAQTRKTAATLINLLKTLVQQTTVKVVAGALVTTAIGKAAIAWGAETLNQVGLWLKTMTPIIVSYLEALGYSSLWLMPIMPL